MVGEGQDRLISLNLISSNQQAPNFRHQIGDWRLLFLVYGQEFQKAPHKLITFVNLHM
jgi:hypothetical protein